MVNLNNLRELARRLNLQNIAKGEIELKETKMSNLDYVEYLFRCELDLREDNVIYKRQKASKLPDVEYNEVSEKGVTAWQVSAILKFDWLKDDCNLFITGKCNCGKTALAAHVGKEAVKQRHKVYYITMDKFLEVIQTKNMLPKSQKIFSYIKECQLLIIDEVMYLPLTNEELQIFYKIITFLNAAQSIVFITNRELSDWHNACEDQHLMQTLISRITSNSQILRLDTNEAPSMIRVRRKSPKPKE